MRESNFDQVSFVIKQPQQQQQTELNYHEQQQAAAAAAATSWLTDSNLKQIRNLWSRGHMKKNSIIFNTIEKVNQNVWTFHLAYSVSSLHYPQFYDWFKMMNLTIFIEFHLLCFNFFSLFKIISMLSKYMITCNAALINSCLFKIVHSYYRCYAST